MMRTARIRVGRLTRSEPTVSEGRSYALVTEQVVFVALRETEAERARTIRTIPGQQRRGRQWRSQATEVEA